MAEAIIAFVPSIEMIRMVNSGTEATMAALRLARGVTGRARVDQVRGVLSRPRRQLSRESRVRGSDLRHPDSPGVTDATARDTLTVAFNDLDAVRRTFEQQTGSVAAVIVEPVVGNMGVVAPLAGFLGGLRELCTRARRGADLRRGDDRDSAWPAAARRNASA